MPYKLENKVVIAVSTSSLFDMSESDRVFREKGLTDYVAYQEEHMEECLPKGVAFPFIKRILRINDFYKESRPFEVVLFSKDSPVTGMRAFKSIKNYGLDITRAAFTSGRPNFKYLPAFNATLYISSNPKETVEALRQGFIAGTIVDSGIEDNEDDFELRIALDFDGIVAGFSSENVYQKNGIERYMAYEKEKANVPLEQGPLMDFLKKLSFYQRLQKRISSRDSFTPMIRLSIVTARNAPADTRVLTTLKKYDVEVDELFLMGGVEKSLVLNIMKPHLFIDDQVSHFEHLNKVPAIHVPYVGASVVIDYSTDMSSSDEQTELVTLHKVKTGEVAEK